ncbi:trypsin-like peptidase domain-containing protein [Clostridium perfringens]|uniref:Trypsin-like peptidase domain-containing protein n=1 Tax=Clostridium perfringens TaxID=1502 RepID=A0ABD4PPN5_CLOPF|nr:trypsin-like peptidase domain-containing protein [Clostridium perfringens]MBO3337622.1 trypsin-like peptidase domain-containing protein [Clostridium perfringens]MBO3384205.1 trypsin-like peptidase domain-containing protein [Clostridium perfringens]MBO3395981.1 trypsin-like peptidase domain-containing protein [Clostridium perfringens]MBO3416341.1 trypsin-like peptidase domain-containing protein [Clostridium perfringens]MBO3419823.1 trypsin-like peptidase domain-containing protein [Clostridiu
MSDFNKKDQNLNDYFGFDDKENKTLDSDKDIKDKENIESNNDTKQTNIDETQQLNIDNEINSKDEVKKDDDKNFSDVKSKSSKESNDNSKNKKVKKKSGFKRGIALVAGAVIVAILGGAIGAGGVYYAFKNSIPVSTLENNSNTSVNPPAFKGEDGELTVPQVVEKVTPAVVGVSTKSLVRDQFFNVKEQEGLGSGFIINEDGYVVTNYHVINGAQEVKVIFSDGKEVNAKVVNYDAERDIAVIKITDDVKMPGIAQLGDSSTVKAGEEVIAIGNPLGKEFSSTVTKGIVSSPNRKMKTENGNVLDYIQTDAAINPGNSGGPLINSKGEVIGINTAKKVGEDIEGIGFAIPINEVKTRLGSLSKPILKLGITARTVTPELAKENKLEEGVYVVGVQEFSPAEKAGLKIGDLIVEFGGKRVKTLEELNQVKSQYNDGDSVPVEIIRDGKKVNLNLTLVAN